MSANPILQGCAAHGEMDGELLAAYKIISSFEQLAVCKVCPYISDKHDMNCIECCPWRRAVAAAAPKKQPELHKPKIVKGPPKCATCRKKLGANPFTTMWCGKPKKFCSGECFSKYNNQDSGEWE